MIEYIKYRLGLNKFYHYKRLLNYVMHNPSKGLCVDRYNAGICYEDLPLVFSRECEIRAMYNRVKPVYWFNNDLERIDYLKRVIKGEIK